MNSAICICKPSTRTFSPLSFQRIKYKIWTPETHIHFTVFPCTKKHINKKLYICDESYFSVHFVYKGIKLPIRSLFLYSATQERGMVCFSSELHNGNKYFDTQKEINQWVAEHHYNARGCDYGMELLEELTKKSKHKEIFKYLTNS